MAKEKGFYQEEGLDVKLVELNEHTDVVEKVLNNDNYYGVGDSALLYHILNFKQLELLMPIYENSPFVLTAINYKKDIKLKDIVDYNITLGQFAIKNPAILAMLKSQNIDIDKLKIKRQNFYNDIYQKGVFAFYISNEIYTLKKHNIKYKIFNPQDYGINFYGDILFTSKSTLTYHPDDVRRLLKATKRGYIYAFNHIDETIKVILKKYNTQKFSYDKLKYEAVLLKSLLSKDFKFNLFKIENIENIFILLGLVKKKISPKNFVYTIWKLTKKERDFIENHKIHCVSTSSWEPFNLMKDSYLQGIAIDYWNVIKKRLDLKTDCEIKDNWNDVLDSIKNKKFDITLSTDVTPDRKEYALFSKAYSSFPVVIATRNDVGFIEDITNLENKLIAVGKNYTAEKLLKIHYPNLKLLEVKNTDEALKMVSKGKVFAAADILPIIAYKINKYQYSNLKISGKTDAIFNVRFMVRDDYGILIPMINRVIDSMSEEQKKEIYRKWISVTYQKGFSDRYVKRIIFIVIAILFFALLWIIFMRNEILKRDKLEQELEKLATKDRLTGIYNRYKLDIELEKQIQLSNRYHRPFSIVFFDIDHFKDINDSYGHDKGDLVLRELACLTQKNIRKNDIFGRWGGEEFLIICPEIGLIEATKLAEKLRRLIETYKFNDSLLCSVTCSFGVTQFVDKDTQKIITKRVDTLLYEAKQKGRNRTVSG